MFDNDKIYILDRKVNEVFIFGRKGRYLNKIVRQGQGRDEYLDIDEVNVYKSNIFILCFTSTCLHQSLERKDNAHIPDYCFHHSRFRSVYDRNR